MHTRNEKNQSVMLYPFQIICRKCGKDEVNVRHDDALGIIIKCHNCGWTAVCPSYDTKIIDYSKLFKEENKND